MPSTIRKMKLLEAFNTMGVMGEIRLVELAQVLAERFPKRIVTEEAGVEDGGSALDLSQFRILPPSSVQTI